MINIIRKEDCVGCDACVQKCPKQCIAMHTDDQGFAYPEVDLDLCIDCHLCEKVCPVINKGSERAPIDTYACKNNDDKVRRNSSSGGVFYALACKTIDEGGVVFGARFDSHWLVMHDWATSMDGIKEFMGSKYVQSHIGDCFKRSEEFLRAGRKVLFSGTPCQISALNRYLTKDYGDLLLKVEVICHGVPSPRVWKDYLNSIARPSGAQDKNSVCLTPKPEKMTALAGISFRDKRKGWQKFGLALTPIARKGDQNTVWPSGISSKGEFYEPLTRNLYLRGFLSNVFLRPSCFECPCRSGKSAADISLGDFWGIHRFHPSFHDDKGVSLVLCWTEAGRTAFGACGLNSVSADYRHALISNPAINKDAPKPDGCERFWAEYNARGLEAVRDYLRSIRPVWHKRVVASLKNAVRPVYFFLLRFKKK